jgi:hypothetical protein
MAAQKEKALSSHRKLWRWIRILVVQDAPEDIAPCEFECRRPECRQGDWEVCEKRLHRVSEGAGPAE